MAWQPLYLPLMLAAPSYVCTLRSSIGSMSLVNISFTTTDNVFPVVSGGLYNPMNISLTVSFVYITNTNFFLFEPGTILSSVNHNCKLARFSLDHGYDASHNCLTKKLQHFILTVMQCEIGGSIQP